MDADGVKTRASCHCAPSCSLKALCAHPRSTHRRRGVHRLHTVDCRGTVVGGSAHALVWSLLCISSALPRGAPGECAIPDWRRTVDRLVLHRLRLHRPFEGKGNGKALCAAKSQRPGLLFVQFGISWSIQGSKRCESAAQKAHYCHSDVDSCSAGRRAPPVQIHFTQPLNHAWIEGSGAPAGPGRELV